MHSFDVLVLLMSIPLNFCCSQILIFCENKLRKQNHRVQSKISEVSFSMEFRFDTKIGCFITRYCIFVLLVIRPNISSTYNDTRFIVEWHPHSHIQRYYFHKHDVHELI